MQEKTGEFVGDKETDVIMHLQVQVVYGICNRTFRYRDSTTHLETAQGPSRERVTRWSKHGVLLVLAMHYKTVTNGRTVHLVTWKMSQVFCFVPLPIPPGKPRASAD